MFAYNASFWGVALSFSILCFAAARIVPFGQKIKLPAICTYVLVGMAASAVGMLGPRSNLKQLSMVAETGLAFISMSAGAELYLPQIRSSLKQILLLTTAFAFAQLIFGAAFITLFCSQGLLAEPAGATTTQRIALGLLASCVAVALAPGSLLGLVREIQARGPFTSCVMGNTAVGCMLALVLFSMCSSFANTAILGGGFSALALLFLFVNIVVSFLFGWLVGKLVVLLLNLNARYPRVPSHWAILLLGLATEQASGAFDALSLRYLKADLSLEGLLVTITAGYVATNAVGNRTKFLAFLSEVSPYVFVPFFTLSGAKINAGVLAKALLFAIVYVVVRLAACAAACIPLGLALKQPPAFWKGMWLTYAPQGGMSFGLVAKIELMFDEFGTEFGTAILGSVLINNILGVLIAKAGIRMAGEIPDGTAEVDELVATGGPARRVLVVGLDEPTAMAVRRLLEARCHVTLLDTDEDRLRRALELLPPAGPAGPDAPAGPPAAPGGAGIPLSASTSSLCAPGPPTRSGSTETIPGAPASEASEGGEKAASEKAGEAPLARSEVYFARGGLACRLLVPAAGGEAADDDGEAGVEAMVAAVAQQTYDVTGASVESCLVALPAERQAYAVCEYLLHAVRVRRVVVALHNAAWAKAFTELGAVVTQGAALEATVLYKAALTAAEREVQVVRGRPRPGLLNGLLHAGEGGLWPALGGPAGREELERLHPDPRPEWVAGNAQRRLRKQSGEYLSAMCQLNYVEKHSQADHDALVPTALLGAIASGGGRAGMATPSERLEVRVDRESSARWAV